MKTFRIILADSDAGDAERLESLLIAGGHSVFIASDLTEAIDILGIQKFEFVLASSRFSREELLDFSRKLGESTGDDAQERTWLITWSDVGENDGADGYLSPHLDTAGLSTALEEIAVAQQARQTRRERTANAPAMAVFDRQEFEEQCAGDHELMLELIDLFLAECDAEIPAMFAASAEGAYDRLARIAHSMKGSLGSLHASRARLRLQSLEAAAQATNAELCRTLLAATQQDLADLQTELASFRNAST